MIFSIVRFTIRIGFCAIFLGGFYPISVQGAVGPDQDLTKSTLISPSDHSQPLFKMSESAPDQKSSFIQIAKPLRGRHHGLPEDTDQSAESQEGKPKEPDEIPGLEFDEQGQAIPKGHKKKPTHPRGSGQHTQGESGSSEGQKKGPHQDRFFPSEK